MVLPKPVLSFVGISALFVKSNVVFAASKAQDKKWTLTEKEWRERLSTEAYKVLREEGEYQICKKTVMDNITDPDIVFDKDGISNYYWNFLLW